MRIPKRFFISLLLAACLLTAVSSFLLAAAPGAVGRRTDVLHTPETGRGVVAAGTVHHVAYRVPDDLSQAAWSEKLHAAGMQVTEVRDRQYFKSIYFREPGGEA